MIFSFVAISLNKLLNHNSISSVSRRYDAQNVTIMLLVKLLKSRPLNVYFNLMKDETYSHTTSVPRIVNYIKRISSMRSIECYRHLNDIVVLTRFVIISTVNIPSSLANIELWMPLFRSF